MDPPIKHDVTWTWWYCLRTHSNQKSGGYEILRWNKASFFRTPLYGDMDFKTGTPWTGWMWNWVSNKGSWDLRPTLNQKETMILEVQGPSEYLTQPDTEIRIACFFVPDFFFAPKRPGSWSLHWCPLEVWQWTHEHHEEHPQATDWSSRAWAAQMVFRSSFDPNSLDATFDNDSQRYGAI